MLILRYGNKNAKSMKHFFSTICLSFTLLHAFPQEKVVALKYGDMDSWVTRTIHESAVIGGDDKTLYEVGPNKHIDGNNPYRNQGNSPWGTSNVMAKVSGIVKTNNTVYREKRGNGYCARLETHIERVKVLGLVNINVLAAGSLFLGDMTEPITGTKNGEKYQNWGVPFNTRPKALRFDFRFKSSGEPNRIKLTGFGGSNEVKGKDKAIVLFLLQKRTEDNSGNITAKRVGTMVVTYDKSTNGWTNGATYEILYGDIRKNPKYNAETMKLRSVDYARNSKGKNVLVKETGWATANETPTHMLLQFTSSHGGAYIGSPGNTLWIDNVRLVY